MSNEGSGQDWRPTASVETLRQRADIISRIRAFFQAAGVLEVETPLLARAGITDPHIPSFTVPSQLPGLPARYLNTSPEFAMKRLLAAGTGSIFQICKAFREGEAGRLHNPEFTLLEWYRLDYDDAGLMTEVDQLIQILSSGYRQFTQTERLTYADCFRQRLGIDPHSASMETIRLVAREGGLDDVVGLEPDDRDGWLDYLFSHRIQPGLGQNCLSFVHDYPASQAALARLKPGHPECASRFELFIDGVEIANGFHELQDSLEQRQRFEQDLRKRDELGLTAIPIDEYLLDALAAGLPDCAGVALGLDRLILVLLGLGRLDEAMTFPYSGI